MEVYSKNNEIYLSICVPTFDRSNSLEALLLKLRPLKLKYRSEIEVVVSNNCSSDDTREICVSYSDVIDVYHQNSKNIGSARNIIKCLNLAKGSYRLIVGDDDGIRVLGIEKLIDYIKSENTQNWIILPYYVASTKTQSQLTNCSKLFLKGSFLRRLLALGSYELGFLGSHAIPDSSILHCKHLNEREVIGWPHVSIFAKYFQSKRCVFFLNEPCVVQQEGDPLKASWRIDDWLIRALRRTLILANIFDGYILSRLIFIVRELLGRKFSRELFLFKVYSSIRGKNYFDDLVEALRYESVGDKEGNFCLTLVLILLHPVFVIFKLNYWVVIFFGLTSFSNRLNNRFIAFDSVMRGKSQSIERGE